MDNRIPPLVTPFAILSICLALGATNVVANKVTGTSEGTPTSTQTTSQKNMTNSIYGKTTPKKDDTSNNDKAKESSEKAKESSEKAAKESSLKEKQKRIVIC